MTARALKLGTRRSPLARAQSAAIARRLESVHPGLTVELVGIDTRGDRIVDRPLSAVDGKEFFTAEIDQALLGGRVDLTVHSYKDLSLERSAALLLAAVPAREPPFDIALFAPDVRSRLLAGEELRIGSSSPRRATFVPEFLRGALPAAGAAPRMRLVELRGNVDSRLRRLREPRGSERHLDGIVLAFAGLARLWADESGQVLLRELLTGLPRMILPLSACPSAPAQGALAVECRRDDATTTALLAAIDHPPTRRAVAVERALLAQGGGGCHQRLGATQVEFEGLGALFYQRDADAAGQPLPADPPLWTPAMPLPRITGPVRAWDGSQVAPGAAEAIPEATGQLAVALRPGGALFVAHQRALPECASPILDGTHVWVPGLATWRALASAGIWVEGCAEGLGVAALEPLLRQPLLQLRFPSDWTVLTHAAAAAGWPPAARVIATYRHLEGTQATGGPAADVTHVFWHSGAQFDRWAGGLPDGVQHASGAGRTAEHLRAAGVHNLRVFPQVAHWRRWLKEAV